MDVPRYRFPLALVVAAVLVPGLVAQEPDLGALDRWMREVITTWTVPGAAMSIVKDDRMVFAKGYGVREIGTKTRVDERTMFAIGSASKAFTAAALAMLIDDGELRWDDRVITHLPQFALFDPYATREMTVRDLLSHQSGLTRGDRVWYGTALSRDEIVRRVRFLRPAWGLRDRFGYQNIMYIAAGQVAGTISGRSWDALVKERIFAPLGMTASNTSVRDLRGTENVASPHEAIDSAVRVAAWRNIDNAGPAGSINSNVVEMAEWVRLQLGNGKHDGRQLISAANVREMHTPHTVIRLEGLWGALFPESHFLSYGLGWFVNDYRGRRIVSHGGNIDGYTAMVAMMPDEGVGLVILINQGQTNPLISAILHHTFDVLLGGGENNWSVDQLVLAQEFQAQAAEQERRVQAARIPGTSPSLPLQRYTGTYADSVYGETVVTYEGGRLTAEFGSAFVGTLEHWHYDTFRVTWEDPTAGKTFYRFALGNEGKVSALFADLEGTIEFGRKPTTASAWADVAIDEAALRRYAGTYVLDSPPLEVSIELVRGRLAAVVSGQPSYTLAPVSPTRFRVEGSAHGFFLEFLERNGEMNTLRLEQPNGTWELRKKSEI